MIIEIMLCCTDFKETSSRNTETRLFTNLPTIQSVPQELGYCTPIVHE